MNSYKVASVSGQQLLFFVFVQRDRRTHATKTVYASCGITKFI